MSESREFGASGHCLIITQKWRFYGHMTVNGVFITQSPVPVPINKSAHYLLLPVESVNRTVDMGIETKYPWHKSTQVCMNRLLIQ
jgi:hypothetical protein